MAKKNIKDKIENVFETDKDIKALFKKAKKDESITYEEIETIVSQKDLSTEEIDDIFIKLEDMEIAIVDIVDDFIKNEGLSYAKAHEKTGKLMRCIYTKGKSEKADIEKIFKEYRIFSVKTFIIF